MTKLNIRRDNAGYAAGWYLNKVTITTDPLPKYGVLHDLTYMMMGEKEGQKIIQANRCSTQPIPQPTANRHFLHFPGYSLTRPHGFPKLLERGCSIPPGQMTFFRVLNSMRSH